MRRAAMVVLAAAGAWLLFQGTVLSEESASTARPQTTKFMDRGVTMLRGETRLLCVLADRKHAKPRVSFAALNGDLRRIVPPGFMATEPIGAESDVVADPTPAARRRWCAIYTAARATFVDDTVSFLIDDREVARLGVRFPEAE